MWAAKELVKYFGKIGKKYNKYEKKFEEEK